MWVRRMDLRRKEINEDTQDSVVKGENWEDYVFSLTPVEKKSDGMWYKREDKFALHGINTINGSKCRQLLHLFLTRPKGVDTVIHATNVNSSPQTPMTAVMAEHFGLRCIQVAGGSNFKSLSEKMLPKFATMFGTEYEITMGSGFNKNIQRRVNDIMVDFPHAFTIERDITLDHHLKENSADKILAFHNIGAYQTKNFPNDIIDLVIPFGSANSTTSVILGLSRDKPEALKRVHLVNVGVDKRKYMFERLDIMNVDYSQWEFVWHQSGYEYAKTLKDVKVDDITFHYRYEAKVYQHILDFHPELFKDTTLFWVIGSVPDLQTTADNLHKQIPEEVKIFEWEEKPKSINEWL